MRPYLGGTAGSLVAKPPGRRSSAIVSGCQRSKTRRTFGLSGQNSRRAGHAAAKLSIGRTYRFRARAVDLAGNSVPREDLVPDHVTRPRPSAASTRCRRRPSFWRRPFTEGEVAHADGDPAHAERAAGRVGCVTRINKLQGHKDKLLAYIDINERHLAPPHAAQQLAEWHGEFEKAIGKSANHGAGHCLQYRRARRGFVSGSDPGGVTCSIRTLRLHRPN